MNPVTAAPSAPAQPAADPRAAAKAAQEFEGMFLTQMLQSMFTDIKGDTLFGGGHGEEMFRSLLIDEYGRDMARHGGIGLAKAIQNSLLAAQEMGNDR